MSLTQIVFVLLALAAPQVQQPEHSDEPERIGLCDKANTQLELNQCTAEQLKVVRGRLNRLYTTISADLSRSSGATALTKLKAAQQAWLKYRELHCDAARQQVKGSMGPMIWADCMTSVTLSRIEELKFAYPVNGKPRE